MEESRTRQPRGPLITAAKELADLCAQIRQAHPEQPWRNVVVEEAEEQPDPRIEIALKMYQEGAPSAAIASYLSITTAALYLTIARWKKRGWWPADVGRKRGRSGKG